MHEKIKCWSGVQRGERSLWAQVKILKPKLDFKSWTELEKGHSFGQAETPRKSKVTR